jgi:hypothetical protein
MFHWCALLVLAGTQACSGKLAVLKERAPGDTGSGPASLDGSANASAESGSGQSAALSRCPELAVSPLYPIPTPAIACGLCSCEDGQVSCSERACAQPTTLGRCPNDLEMVPNAVITEAMIRGQTLSINVRGHGGCGDVDLQPCYVAPAFSSVASQSVYPKIATIRVLNPTTPSDCNEVVFQHLELGLSTLREFRTDRGNLVDSNLGMVALGELSCEDVGVFAGDQSRRDLARMNDAHPDLQACDTDADCAQVEFAFSCSQLCAGSVVINQAYASELRAGNQRIEDEICAPLAQACGGHPPPTPPCLFQEEHPFCDPLRHSCGQLP